MTRKSVKFPSGIRRGPWKTNLMKHETEDKNVSRRILISGSSAERWSNLKNSFRFKSDSELVDYLLALGEAQPKPSRSPNHDSDDGWRPSNKLGRKKRGPSLRAVLRRSTRSGCKADFLSEPVESEDCQTDVSHRCSEDESERKRKNISRSVKHIHSDDLLSKRHGNPCSGAKKLLDRDEEKETKASRLDAELALLVESVALQPPKLNESELYEFKDDPQSGNSLSPSPSPENGHTSFKTGHKRWKSYNKDRRKWKQSYAAVVSDEDQPVAMKLKDEASEKEKKIFKALKKNRILTAYLDSQNKISDETVKDSCLSRRENNEVQDEKLDAESTSINSIKGADDTVDSDDTKSKDDLCENQIFEKSDVSCGKENKSKSASSTEPVFIEVCEMVKLKRRRKKLMQKSEEPLSNLDLQGDGDSVDSQRSQRKQKRNWKKSIINYELEGAESDLKRKKSPSDSFPNIYDIPCGAGNDSNPTQSTSYEQLPVKSEKSVRVNHLNDSYPAILKNDAYDDNSSAEVKHCSECFLQHSFQPCPVQNPHQIVADSVTFEQWQLQCQVQVRCSVIEPPRPKPGRFKRGTLESSNSNDVEKNTRENKNFNVDENTRIYADESLPLELELQLLDEEHGKSIFARSAIAQYTQFGPLVGPRIQEKDISDESDMRHIWEVWDGKRSEYLNTEDPQKSNWLRFMRPAAERDNRNITLSVQNKQLYFTSIVDIPEGSELLYWADDHISSWSKKKILKSSCGGCNIYFAHPLYYRTHCAVFHDPFHSLTVRKYHCKVCGEAVMGKENIMKHAADLHEGRGAYQCQYCLKFFLRLNYLEMHRTYGCSSNPHRTRPLCDFCGRYFCQPQKLKVHIKRMHSDMNEVLREFQCKSCLKILGSRAALQRHFKEVHHRDVVVASNNCDKCGKSFQNRSNLKIHMLTHSGVKPFRCQQEGCSAAFTTKQCLQFHYKKAHGLSESTLPRIERSIAYTFDAYAGEGAVSGSKGDREQSKKQERVLRKSRKSSTKSQRNQSNEGQSNVDETVYETIAPQSSMPTGNETSVVSEIPEPVQDNHPYSSFDENMAVQDSSHEKVIDSRVEQRSPVPQIGLVNYVDEERQLGNSKVLTPLRTVTLHHHSEENYNSQHDITCRSPSPLPQSHVGVSSSHDLHSMISLESKGHKKWLGEVIEVAEEAAAAAMRLSPRLSPLLKKDIYDFDESKVKSKLQFIENPIRPDLQMDLGVGRSKTGTALAPFHHPESASLLVEAALDAAEKDICCPSLATKISSNSTSHSPEPFHITHSYLDRSQCEETTNASYYTPDLSSVPHPNHYILDHSQNSHSHLQPLDTYSIPSTHIGASKLYEIHSHQVHHSELPSQGPPSSDDEGGVDSDCNSRGDCAQNLSLNAKDKICKRSVYATHQHPELSHRSSSFQEHVPLPQQNDLSFSGSMIVSSPRYHLYDVHRDRQCSEVPVTDLTVASRSLPEGYDSYQDLNGSVDLSVSRSHAPGDNSILPLAPTNYHTEPSHHYAPAHCVSSYSTHSTAYINSPVQRSHVSSSSNSPSASPSPGPVQYHAYSPYY